MSKTVFTIPDLNARVMLGNGQRVHFQNHSLITSDEELKEALRAHSKKYRYIKEIKGDPFARAKALDPNAKLKEENAALKKQVEAMQTKKRGAKK